MNSERFKKLKGDKFKAVKKNEKIQLDKRFERFRKDEAFTKIRSEDKYGTEKRFKTKDTDFDEFYKIKDDDNKSGSDLEDSSESNDDETVQLESKNEDQKKVCAKNKVSDSESITSDEETIIKNADSDESVTSDTSEDEEDEENYSSLLSDEEVEDKSEVEPTSRMALCKMDWEHINAQDIYMLAVSFLPEGGKLKSVKVYPSEFGLQEMKKESVTGPVELLSTSKDETPADKKRRLLQYQKKKLKYYYAIIECDSAKTAQHLDKELDGLQFMDNILPLRLKYVPEDMTFDHASPSSEAYSESKNYEPLKNLDQNVFQRVNFEPTWDNTDPHRNQFIQKAFQNPESIEVQDLKQYLASASESSEDEAAAQERIKIMKELLNSEGSTDPFKKSKSLSKPVEKMDAKKVEEPQSDDEMSDALPDDDGNFFMEPESKPKTKVKKHKKPQPVMPDKDEDSEDDESMQGKRKLGKSQGNSSKKVKLTVEKESAKEKRAKKKLKKKEQQKPSANLPKKGMERFESQFKASGFAS